MAKQVTLRSPHLSRVEGHGGITLLIEGSKLKKVEVNITEGNRFFEPLARGYHFREVFHRASRICAICSVSHHLASIRACEDAFGYTPSDNTNLFRHILHYGEVMESNLLHIFVLALPDFFACASILEFAREHRNIATAGLGLKALANKIMEIVGGRAIHPCAPIVGGFTSFPQRSQLQELKRDCAQGLATAQELVDFLATIEMPANGGKKNLFVALQPKEGGFGFLGSEIVTSQGAKFPVRDYRKHLTEEVVAHSRSKQVRLDDEPFCVGALARVAIFHDGLTPQAKAAVQKLRIMENQDNVFYITPAQMVETVFALERLLDMLDKALADGDLTEKPVEPKPKAGIGVGAVEAPRGLLIHEYTFDKAGLVTAGNMVNPTTINQLHIEQSLRYALEPMVAQGEPADKIKFAGEMLMRAYDPCLSCSVHIIDLRGRE
jgi:sulfhydrogenase subunit alpha